MTVGASSSGFIGDRSGATRPSIDKAPIRELAAGRSIANGDAAPFLGPPWVGKTHLAVALAREAIVAGYSTLVVPATTQVAKLARLGDPVTTARLIDAETGGHVWATRFDETGKDVLAIEAGVAERVPGAVAGGYSDLEGELRRLSACKRRPDP